MHIIRLPSGEYVNLAFIRRVQVEVSEPGSVVVIHWQGGGSQVYHGENAQAVDQIMAKITNLNTLHHAEALVQAMAKIASVDIVNYPAIISEAMCNLRSAEVAEQAQAIAIEIIETFNDSNAQTTI